MTRRCAATWARRIGAACLGLVLAGGCRDDATAVTPPCGQAPLLVPGQVLDATLGAGDPRRAGAYIHYFTLEPTRPAAIRLEMSSVAVDPFLYLFNESGAVIAQAFPRIATTGSRTATLEWELERTCHTVGASSWTTGVTGAYTLSFEIHEVSVR